MAVKSSGTGAFLIPTAPAVGTTVTGGAANTFTTNAVQLIASTSAAIFITGLHVQLSSTSKPTYVVIRLSTGAGDGSIVGEFVVPYAYTAGATGTQMMGYVQIYPWIAVAASTRIGAKSADSVGSLNHTVILQCINQSNVVAEGAINETANVIQINSQTASASGTVTFPNATLASTTNITAGTITTATNVTTVNGLAAGVITAAAIADGAIDAATFAAGAINNAAMSIDGSELTAIPWNASWDAEVQSEVQDAIEANNLDHLVKIAVDTNFATTVHLDSVIGQLADNGTTATFDRTTDSLEALQAEHDATQAAALTAAGVRSAVGLASANLDTQLTAIDDFLDTEIAAIKAVTDALPNAGALTTIQSDLDDIQSRLPAALVSGRMDSSVGAMAANTLTASALAADAVTEIQSGLATSAALATVQADTDNIQTRLPAALSGDGFIKADLRSIDDELTSGGTANLNLNSVNIDNTSGGSAVYIAGGIDAFPAMYILHTANGDAVKLESVGTGKSINAPQNIAVSDGDLTLTNIAKKVLTLDWTTVTGEAARSVLNALRKLRNKVSFNGTTTLTVYKEDGTTSAYTQAVTMDDAQEPFKELGN